MDVRTDPCWRGGSGHSLCLVGTVRRFPRDFPRSVCSPKLLAEGQAIHGAHDFGGYPLIHFDWFANDPTAPNWEGGSRRHRPPRAPTDRAIRMHKKNRRVAARHPFSNVIYAERQKDRVTLRLRRCNIDHSWQSVLIPMSPLAP